MRHYSKRQLTGFAAIILVALSGCGISDIDRSEMQARLEQLKETSPFQYPLDNFFPDIPMTIKAPPKGDTEKYHAAEDSFAPAGTPVYAIGDGVISFSGRKRGYGGLIIINHPDQNVYSLYGHLSTSRWKMKSGEVEKGDLIAYLGESEEIDSMIPHIHFGIRMGQRAEYSSWRWDDRRWMAGYSSRPPDQVGWFEPSEIIGKTEAMKKWHNYIRKREDIVTDRILDPSDFQITSGKYNEKEDLDQAIVKEFGDHYRLADWNDILAFSDNIEEWADSVGLLKGGEDNSLMISNDGYRIWLGRQYFISRFNHEKPRHYLAHRTINKDYVCLGSWQDLNNHALVVRK